MNRATTLRRHNCYHHEKLKSRKIIKMTLGRFSNIVRELCKAKLQTGPAIPHISQLFQIEWMKFDTFFDAKPWQTRKKRRKKKTFEFCSFTSPGELRRMISLSVSMMFRELRLIELYVSPSSSWGFLIWEFILFQALPLIVISPSSGEHQEKISERWLFTFRLLFCFSRQNYAAWLFRLLGQPLPLDTYRHRLSTRETILCWHKQLLSFFLLLWDFSSSSHVSQTEHPRGGRRTKVVQIWTAKIQNSKANETSSLSSQPRLTVVNA